ncbi:cupin domain-containing protein [Ferrovibrio xuzhouensis]|uniref:Cupin domain-containing protein n=1 Tax=Ferrovibrio xuzhouensis TaxID=1576914 RepID=A0ABV7VGE2_9PROT
MADPAPASASVSRTDWLSRLLDLVPVRGELELRCSFGAPWRVDEAPAPAGEMPYHVVLAGTALLDDAAGGAPRQLGPGDILLLPGGGAHRLHDGSGAAPSPVRKHRGAAVILQENTGSGARFDMLCGRFVLAPMHDRLLRGYLPPRLVVPAAADPASATATQVAGLVALLRGESVSDSLGARAMLNALSTALFALVLRRASETDAAPDGLLALAGHPRLAPALGAMFADPVHPWTLEALAALCNMSRATAARQFDQHLGRSAADLLADIRMTVAAAELAKPHVSTGAAADAAGYQSEAAFQRAFKTRMGLTPAQWRRQAMGGGEDR